MIAAITSCTNTSNPSVMIGAALLVPGSLAIISATFDAADRGRAIGTWSGFSGITAKFGALEGDRVLVEFAKILRTVFRGADLAFRQGGDEFLIMMPDTTEEQADCPVQRLLREVDQWNLSSKRGYELSFSWALAPYVTGSDAEDVLQTVFLRIAGRDESDGSEPQRGARHGSGRTSHARHG
mgnify:CR=1 FL=1